jgi:hypothetical protein
MVPNRVPEKYSLMMKIQMIFGMGCIVQVTGYLG